MRVQRTETIESPQVVADADGLTSRAGRLLIVGVADRVGLSEVLSVAMGGLRQRRSRHDPGRTLRDLAVMLADGGDCLSPPWLRGGVSVKPGRAQSARPRKPAARSQTVQKHHPNPTSPRPMNDPGWTNR